MMTSCCVAAAAADVVSRLCLWHLSTWWELSQQLPIPQQQRQLDIKDVKPLWTTVSVLYSTVHLSVVWNRVSIVLICVQNVLVDLMLTYLSQFCDACFVNCCLNYGSSVCRQMLAAQTDAIIDCNIEYCSTCIWYRTRCGWTLTLQCMDSVNWAFGQCIFMVNVTRVNNIRIQHMFKGPFTLSVVRSGADMHVSATLYIN